MDEKQAQKHKALSEYLRFVITLSTGSIVLLVSILEKLQAQPNSWVSVAFIGFTVCIFTSIIAYSFVTMNFGGTISNNEGSIIVGVMVITWFSFITAIVALTMFGLGNLFNPPGFR